MSENEQRTYQNTTDDTPGPVKLLPSLAKRGSLSKTQEQESRELGVKSTAREVVKPGFHYPS